MKILNITILGQNKFAFYVYKKVFIEVTVQSTEGTSKCPKKFVEETFKNQASANHNAENVIMIGTFLQGSTDQNRLVPDRVVWSGPRTGTGPGPNFLGNLGPGADQGKNFSKHQEIGLNNNFSIYQKVEIRLQISDLLRSP